MRNNSPSPLESFVKQEQEYIVRSLREIMREVKPAMRQTLAYKEGFIHLSYINNREQVWVQVNTWAYTIQVKSVHAAKLLITKQRR